MEDLGLRQRTNFSYIPVHCTSKISSIYSLLELDVERVIQASEAVIELEEVSSDIKRDHESEESKVQILDFLGQDKTGKLLDTTVASMEWMQNN